MKLIKALIVSLLLITLAACSKEEKQPDTNTNVQKAATDIIKTEAISIERAQQALEDAKQINQTVQDSEEQQRQAIEKAQK